MSLVVEASSGPEGGERQRSPLWVLLVGLIAAAVVAGVFVVNGQPQPGHSARRTTITILGVTMTMRVPHTTFTSGPPIPVTVTVDNHTGLTWVDPGICQRGAISTALSSQTTPPRLATAPACARSAHFPPGRTVEHLSAPTIDTEHGGDLPPGTYSLDLVPGRTDLPQPGPILVTLMGQGKVSRLVSTGVSDQAYTTIDLPTDQVQAGATLTATMVIGNRTPHVLPPGDPPVCQANAYSLELSGPDGQVARVPYNRAPCAQPFAFPLGNLYQPLAVAAVDADTGRPLRPGRYQAGLRLNGFDLALPRPIVVTVTPAPSPGGDGVQGYPG